MPTSIRQILPPHTNPAHHFSVKAQPPSAPTSPSTPFAHVVHDHVTAAALFRPPRPRLAVPHAALCTPLHIIGAPQHLRPLRTRIARPCASARFARARRRLCARLCHMVTSAPPRVRIAKPVPSCIRLAPAPSPRSWLRVSMSDHCARALPHAPILRRHAPPISYPRRMPVMRRATTACSVCTLRVHPSLLPAMCGRSFLSSPPSFSLICPFSNPFTSLSRRSTSPAPPPHKLLYLCYFISRGASLPYTIRSARCSPILPPLHVSLSASLL
ncbi:hypothetical protein B0H14DRAFT_3868481 [Mycena olivaceomarginata]|nr:hypothetical protein B0H14DRAFT_3868481 [Mycena olivaceomarginata]